MPTKSANACPGLAATSCASGEPAPNTVGTSTAIFSRIVFAVATEPKLQPARVYGTQGAGVFVLGALVIMLNFVSVGVDVLRSKIGEVQYAKETALSVEPSGLKKR